MIGTTLGSYKISRELGKGGMGIVYHAEHSMIGKRAAIKVLRAELSQDKEIVGRFFNEAKAVTSINHPGLVDVYDFGFAADGSAFIVMELLEGESLAQRLEREKRLPLDLVVAVIRQIAGALGAAHAQQIVHRDLKPDNIFMCPDPDVPIGVRAKILDFGIAKLAPTMLGEDTPHTRTGMMMGTPLYMAPEQCRGAGAVDHRADIYALGVILYEMLVGRVPFLGVGMGEVIAMHQYEVPPPPRSIVSTIPVHVEALILKMLAKKPEDRPQTLAAVAAAVEGTSGSSKQMPIAETMAATPTTTAKRDPLPSTLAGAASEAVASPAPTATSGRWKIFAALGAVAVAGTIGVVAMTSGGDQPAVAQQPAVQPSPPVEPKAEPKVEAKVEPTPVEPVKPSKVTLQIDSEPSNAEVFRAFDGVRLGTTPFKLQLDRTDGQAIYLVRLATYQDARVALDASKDAHQRITLTPITKPKAFRPPTTTPPPPVEPQPPQAVNPFKKSS